MKHTRMKHARMNKYVLSLVFASSLLVGHIANAAIDGKVKPLKDPAVEAVGVAFKQEAWIVKEVFQAHGNVKKALSALEKFSKLSDAKKKKLEKLFTKKLKLVVLPPFKRFAEMLYVGRDIFGGIILEVDKHSMLCEFLDANKSEVHTFLEKRIATIDDLSRFCKDLDNLFKAFVATYPKIFEKK